MSAVAIVQTASGRSEKLPRASEPGWVSKPLGDVCTLQRGFDLPTQDRRAGSFPLISSSGVIDTHDEAPVSGPGVVTGRSGSIGNVFFVEEDFWPLNTTLYVRDFHGNDPRFVYHLLKSFDLKSYAGGTGVPTLNRNDVHSELVNLPSSVGEQQRIAAILDEAFEGIAIARANAEKNLLNARELFASKLDAAFSQHSTGCSETTLGAEIALLPGFAFPSGGYTEAADSIRLLRGDNIMQGYLRWEAAKKWLAADSFAYARFALQEGDVVLAMDRPWVKAGLKRAQITAEDLPCLLVQRTARLRPLRTLSKSFLFHLTGSQTFSRHLLELQTGIGVPHISGKQIESFRFMRPPISDQEVIARQLDELDQNTQRLVDVYERKLAALDDLKQSLLRQAVTGQLTASKPVRVAQPATLPTTAPEFVANVIAFAHARHERQGREKTFGHVKEQKTLHLVEAIAKIDLGRQPMRDAAGPNDQQHMIRAEKWAKANNFFEMVPRDGRYEFKKLGAFEEQLSKARQALAPYLPQLESVIDLLVPMDKVEAEVFTTVLAAWNNLLIEGAAVTDEAIVSAAREGWHADKLAIPVQKFHRSIDLIRQKGLVPDGTAKYVGGQQTLL